MEEFLPCRNCGGFTNKPSVLCRKKCEKEYGKNINKKSPKISDKDTSCYICEEDCHVFEYKRKKDHRCGCTYCFANHTRAQPFKLDNCKNCGEYYYITENGYCSYYCESQKN